MKLNKDILLGVSVSMLGLVLGSVIMSAEFYYKLVLFGTFNDDKAGIGSSFASSISITLGIYGFLALLFACSLVLGIREHRIKSRIGGLVEKGLFAIGSLSLVSAMGMYYHYYLPEGTWHVPLDQRDSFITFIKTFYIRILPIVSCLFLAFSFGGLHAWRAIQREANSSTAES